MRYNKYLPCTTSLATEGISISSSTSLYTSTSCKLHQWFIKSRAYAIEVGKRIMLTHLQTSCTWSLESSVRARISCLRIPSSNRKRRAPSLMVSVRSSFFCTCQLLECSLLRQKYEINHSFSTALKPKNTQNKQVEHVHTCSWLGTLGYCSSWPHFPLQGQLGFRAVSTGRHHL